jgi:hypothetical protein
MTERDKKDVCRVDIDPNDKDVPKYVGFVGEVGNSFMIVISIIGIIINSSFSISYFYKIFKAKAKSKKGISIIRLTLSLVAFIETVISICWLINNSFIQNTDKLINRCQLCQRLAHFEVFFYIFDWMILSSSLYQIKRIIINPREYLVATKVFIYCLLFCLGISLFSLLFTFLGGIVGVSPMLTCFINVRNIGHEVKKQVCFWFFFLLPIFSFSFAFYQVFQILGSTQYKNDKTLFKEYSYFIITYIFFSILLILCYIVNFFKDGVGGTGYRAYIGFTTFFACLSPLIVGSIRIYRTDFIRRLLSKKKEEQLIEGDNAENDKIYEMEIKPLEKLILKYFIAISYSLGKSKYESQEGEEGNQENQNILNDKPFDSTEHVVYKISKADILKDLDLAINEDIKVLEEPNIDIEVTEYNSSVFKKLRSLEGFNEDKIISMFQPKKGTFELIKEVKNGMNINSTNKLLMLKQIKKDNLLFYQRNVLADLYNYLLNHPKSLICRVFGLYKIKIDQGEEIYYALIYNVNESLEIVENISLLNQGKQVKQMKVNEIDLKRNIIIDTKKNVDDHRNMTIDVPNTNFDASFVGGSSSSSKTFKINLTDYENDKLLNIINQDAQYLRGKNINGFKFLVFERNIENKDRISLLKEDAEKGENQSKLGTSSKLSSHIKKYIFNSNLSNIIYSISIVILSNKRA